MNRRNFLTQTPIAGFALGMGSSVFTSCTPEKTTAIGFSQKNTMEKVVLAMLSMQRATWEQGVAMQALLELGEKELVILMAKDAVLRQSEEGRPAMLGGEFALADAASPGEAILWAAKETGDVALMNGYEKLLAYFLQKAPRTDEGIIYHFTNSPQVWSDSNYMLPPFLAVAGEFDEAMKQIEGVRNYLWNAEKKLFSHMYNCRENQLVREAFWGVGNGWTAAGYTRVINSLPRNMREAKMKLQEYTTDLLEGCIRYVRADGLFHNIIDDSESFVEANLSQQLAYSIYKGIKSGWLDTKYREAADTMRQGALAKVDDLGLVQDVCGSPEFNHAGTATEGQVFHVLMEVAYGELIKDWNVKK